MTLTLDVVVPPEEQIGRRAWERARAAYPSVGASAVGAVLGVDAYRSPWQVWDDLTHNRVTPSDTGDKADMGHRLEDAVAVLFGDVHPEWVVLPSPGTIRHPTLPYLTATPDRLLAPDPVSDPELGLEVKAPGYWQHKHWQEDDLPPRYRLQAQANIACTGAPGWWVRALIGGQQHAEVWVERDPYLIARIEWEVPAWYERHVLGGEPPPLDPDRDAAELRARLAAPTDPDPLILDPAHPDAVELLRLRALWRAGKDAENAGKAAAEEASDRARVLLAGHRSAVIGDVVVATNTPQRGKVRDAIRKTALSEFDGPEYRDPDRPVFRWKGATS